jgi:hypothetical protein
VSNCNHPTYWAGPSTEARSSLTNLPGSPHTHYNTQHLRSVPTIEQTITEQAIQDARFGFLLRAYQPFLEKAAADIKPVVIARNVTIAQLQTIPIQWFNGVRVALLNDGSLVVTDIDSITATDEAAGLGKYLLIRDCRRRPKDNQLLSQ